MLKCVKFFIFYSLQIFALWASIGTVLVLPLDVANVSSSGGLSIAVFWQVAYITLAVLVCAVIPFAFFYYEADDTDDEGQQSDGARIGGAVKMTLIFVISICVLIFLMYNYLGSTDIPVINWALSGGAACLENGELRMKNNAMSNSVDTTCGLMHVSYVDANSQIKQGTVTGTAWTGCFKSSSAGLTGSPGCQNGGAYFISYTYTIFQPQILLLIF